MGRQWRRRRGCESIREIRCCEAWNGINSRNIKISGLAGAYAVLKMSTLHNGTEGSGQVRKEKIKKEKRSKTIPPSALSLLDVLPNLGLGESVSSFLFYCFLFLL